MMDVVQAEAVPKKRVLLRSQVLKLARRIVDETPSVGDLEDDEKRQLAEALIAESPLRVTELALARSRQKTNREGPYNLTRQEIFQPAKPPPGVLPQGQVMAFDAATIEVVGWAAQGAYNSAFQEGTTFLGYAYLSELAQRAEYRVMSEVIGSEMTREWIEFKTIGDEKKDDKLKELADAFKHMRVQQHFAKAAIHDGFFGRGHIYLDTGDTDDRPELQQDIGNGREDISKLKVNQKKKLEALRNVEPVWTYPTSYDSNDPLKESWYKPTSWFVMGKQLHASRLLTFIGREVPDLLKPAYSFGGLSMSQMAKPYVDNWLRTRQSVADIIQAFSVMVLSTDLQSTLQNGGEQLFARLELFNNLRNNKSVMAVDKNSEDFKNISAPISGLDALQAQTQEHMSSVSRIPLVKLLGIQPAGLNASSEGEIRAFYDWIKAFQELLFRDNLERVMCFIMLSLWGEVDKDITFEFADLWQLDEAGAVGVEKTRTDIDDANVALGAISGEEVRQRLANDPKSQYKGLDLTQPLAPPEDEFGMGEDPDAEPEAEENEPPPGAKDPANRFANEITTQAEKFGGAGTGGFKGDIAFDADFEEEEHPRDADGKFSSGGGGGGSLKEAKIEGGKRTQANGLPLPLHVEKLRIPPAWTDVKYSENPHADLLAVGKDSKGRPQSIYSDSFSARQASIKFARIEELREKFGYISKQNEDARRSSNSRIRDSGDCLYLIMKMGVRPGSETDTGASVKAYGATTLEGRHVVVDNNNVSLRFVGKKGVALDLPVEDSELANMLKKRASAAGAEGKLFPQLNEKSLLAHVSSLDGGGFKTKDFRTHIGTTTAYSLVAHRPAPKSETEYKKSVMDVAKEVSRKLGNTPVIALQSYINPSVFSEWRASIS